MTTSTRRRLLSLAAAGALCALFAAGPAAAQTRVTLGSSSETAGEAEWTLGIGYDFDFPALPFSIGVLGQTTVGRREPTGAMPGETRRSFPARAFGVLKAGLLPAPGFDAYLGVGGGVSARFRSPGADRTMTPAGIALAGFSAGRVSLEVQYQRDFAEEAVNRWVYLLGVAF